MILTEFRVIQSLSNRDMDKFIIKMDLQETPSQGEIVNIDGFPYVVYSKGWSYDEDGEAFCYVHVLDT